MTEEKKNVLMKLRNAEAIYVLMSDFTRMPFVECDEETFDDEVFLYFHEEDAKKEAQKRGESGDKVHVAKFLKQFLLPFYTGFYPMGVNCLVVDKGTENETSVQLSELIVRNEKEVEKQGRPIVENQELHLTALYFMPEDACTRRTEADRGTTRAE